MSTGSKNPGTQETGHWDLAEGLTFDERWGWLEGFNG